MTVYVAEVSGRGIVAFEAANDADAAARLTDRTLLRDLRVLQNEGRSLWDGVSEIGLREPSPPELEIWQERPIAPKASVSDDDRSWRVYLVAVVDPSEFDDDDDDDDDDYDDGPGD